MDDNKNNIDLNQAANKPNISQRGRKQSTQSPINQPRRYNPLNPSNEPQISEVSSLPPKSNLDNNIDKKEGIPVKTGLNTNNNQVSNSNNIDIDEEVIQEGMPKQSKRNIIRINR